MKQIAVNRIVKSLLFVLLIYVIYSIWMHLSKKNDIKGIQKYTHVYHKSYYVDSSMCKIPFVEPFTPEVLAKFEKPNIKSCKNVTALVTAEFDDVQQLYILHVHRDQEDENINFTCHYQEISRSDVDYEADSHFNLSTSVPFIDGDLVPRRVQFMIVKCVFGKISNIIYEDAFAFVQSTLKNNETKKNNPKRKAIRKPSIFMMGIDSMSRINFQRALPNISQLLRQPGWYELQGYNSVDDSTLSNLMAVLSGYTTRQAEKNICNTRTPGCLDSIPFIWKKFRDAGYRTVFAEDSYVTLNTSNNLRPGFLEPPVDYYLRPFLVAITKELERKVAYLRQECIANRLSMDYVLDYCKQFIKRHVKTESIFGLCWTNAFVDPNYHGPSKFEPNLLRHLQEFNRSGLFNESIVILFSDHGSRVDMLRHLTVGFLEERLPILYIWLPPWFRQKYPHFAEGLELNRNRLTSNYDLYMTLEHIFLVGSVNDMVYPKKPQPLSNCKDCQTLFYPVIVNRSCSDAGISEHWCTCHEYAAISISDPKINHIVALVLESMNINLIKKNLSSICSSLTLNRVIAASQQTAAMQNYKDEFTDIYRIRFEVKEEHAEYEVTANYNNTNNTVDFDPDTISCLKSYSYRAYCTDYKEMKRFCVCNSYLKKKTKKSKILSNKNLTSV